MTFVPRVESSNMNTASSRVSRTVSASINSDSYADPHSNSVEFPDDLAQTLDSTEHIHVEQDGVVSTQ